MPLYVDELTVAELEALTVEQAATLEWFPPGRSLQCNVILLPAIQGELKTTSPLEATLEAASPLTAEIETGSGGVAELSAEPPLTAELELLP